MVFLLSERGFAGLTMLALAKEAGVSMATLGARYEDRDAAVVGALHLLVQRLDVPAKGTLDTELRAWLGVLNDQLNEPRSTRLISALLDEATRNPVIAQALNTGVTAPVRTDLKNMFERAVARGEMRADVDLEVAVDLTVGPIYLRHLESVRPTGDAFIDEHAGLVLAAVSVDR